MTVALTVAITADQARTLTDRIKVGVEGIWQLITEAYTSGAHRALGYANWDDYCTREFGTSRLRLPREERSEVVASLREAGLSIPAIAKATGMGVGTVHRALPAPTPFPSGKPAAPPTPEGAAFPDVPDEAPDADWIANGPDPWDDEPALSQEECEALDGKPAWEAAGEEAIADLEATMTDAELARMQERNAERITGTDGKSYPAERPSKPPRKPLPDQFWRAVYDLGKGVERVAHLTADDRFKRNTDQIAQASLGDLIRARDALQGVIDQLQPS